MFCEEAARLKSQLVEAEAWLAEVQHDVQVVTGRIALDDLKVLRRRLDRAWQRRTRARMELNAHTVRHGCLWIS